MKTPEEKKKEINSTEESAKIGEKEGELTDDSAATATGGIRSFECGQNPDEDRSYMEHSTPL